MKVFIESKSILGRKKFEKELSDMSRAGYFPEKVNMGSIEYKKDTPRELDYKVVYKSYDLKYVSMEKIDSSGWDIAGESNDLIILSRDATALPDNVISPESELKLMKSNSLMIIAIIAVFSLILGAAFSKTSGLILAALFSLPVLVYLYIYFDNKKRMKEGKDFDYHEGLQGRATYAFVLMLIASLCFYLLRGGSYTLLYVTIILFMLGTIMTILKDKLPLNDSGLRKHYYLNLGIRLLPAIFIIANMIINY